MLCTYIGDDKNRTFDILVDGEKLTTVKWEGGETGRFYDVEYPIPPALTRGKTLVKIRIEANAKSTAGRIFGSRTMRENE